MFDFGFNELLLLSILIIVFFGPKELPVVLKAIHNFFFKIMGLFKGDKNLYRISC